jgi:transposase-like protein
MNAGKTYPVTLVEAVRYFSTADFATEYFAKMRWPSGVCCPHCGSTDVAYLANQRRWQCREKHPRRQFSAKVGTIFEESPLGLDKWFVAVWCITNAKNGISSCELARALGVTQKSAWFMLHRVRHAMHVGGFEKFSGECESDETFVGGKAKNMHLSRRKEKIHGTGGAGKAVVHGIIQRGDKPKKVSSKVTATVVGNVKRKTLAPIIQDTVEAGSHVYTDALKSYDGLSLNYVHQVIDHAQEYVRGRVHTNGMENFWSLLKRAISGTYVSVDEPHLQRYVDEQVFRFNERKLNDGERFTTVLPGVVGKRITYKELIGSSDVEDAQETEVAGIGGAELVN